jgi:hypothetical protein
LRATAWHMISVSQNQPQVPNSIQQGQRRLAPEELIARLGVGHLAERKERACQPGVPGGERVPPHPAKRKLEDAFPHRHVGAIADGLHAWNNGLRPDLEVHVDESHDLAPRRPKSVGYGATPSRIPLVEDHAQAFVLSFVQQLAQERAGVIPRNVVDKDDLPFPGSRLQRTHDPPHGVFQHDRFVVTSQDQAQVEGTWATHRQGRAWAQQYSRVVRSCLVLRISRTATMTLSTSASVSFGANGSETVCSPMA